jgi:hypothetical protein
MKNLEFLGQKIFDKNFEVMESLNEKAKSFHSQTNNFVYLIVALISIATTILFFKLMELDIISYDHSFFLFFFFIFALCNILSYFVKESNKSKVINSKKWDFFIHQNYSILTDMLNNWRDRAIEKAEKTSSLTPSDLRAKKYELDEIIKVHLFFEKKILFLQKCKDEIIQKRKELDEE